MSSSFSQDTLSLIPATSIAQGAAMAPFAAAVITSANDSSDIVTCYVMSDNAAAGTLDVSNLPSGSVFAPAGGTLVEITGSPAVVQQALRALLFKPATLPVGSTQTAHLSIVMSNYADNISSNRSIIASVVQDVGVNVAFGSVPAASAISDSRGAAVLSPISVVTAGNDAVAVQVSLGDSALGTLDTSALAGLGISVSGGSNGSVTLRGQAASVTAGLDALVFVPAGQVSGTSASETLTLSATDSANKTTSTATVSVSITGSLPPVVLSGVQASQTIAGGASVFLFPALSLQDRLAGNVTAVISMATTGVGTFDSSFIPQGVATPVSVTPTAGGTSLDVSGSAASVQAYLQALRFAATNPAAGTLATDITLTVAGATGPSTSLTEQLAITASGTAPVLSGIGAVSMSGGNAMLYPSVVLSGPTTAVTATVTLSDTSVAAFDQNAFSKAEGGNTAISYSFASDGTALSLQGSAADVTVALRAIALAATTPKLAQNSVDIATLTVSAAAGEASTATTVTVAGPALQADTLSGIGSAVTATYGDTLVPFAQAAINDPNNGDTVSVTVASSIAGLFQSASLGAGAALSSDGRSVTISGDAASVATTLRALALRLPTQGDVQTVSLSVSLLNRAASSSFSNTPAMETVTLQAPPFWSNTGSVLTGEVFAVSSDASRTAVIDLTHNPNTGIIVFGGDAALSLTAANTTLVLNGDNQSGAVSLASLGNDAVWVGKASVDCVAGGHTRFILGDQDGTSSTVTVHGGTAASQNEFDVWGDGSETQTITTDGVSANVVFGGGANLDYTGGNGTIVLDGAGQTGHVAIHSLGGNTVWAGVAPLDLYENSGDDTVILTGAASTTIHASGGGLSGSISVLSLSNSGDFTYLGGDKTASLQLSGGSNVIDGGTGQETVAMSGGGSLLVSDSAASTGLQSITMAGGSTATMRFLGGANPAKLVLGGGDATIVAGTNTSITGGSGDASIDLSTAVKASLSFSGALTGNLDVTGFDPSRASVQLTDVSGSAIQNGSLVVSFGDGAQAVFHGDTDASHAGIVFG